MESNKAIVILEYKDEAELEKLQQEYRWRVLFADLTENQIERAEERIAEEVFDKR